MHTYIYICICIFAFVSAVEPVAYIVCLNLKELTMSRPKGLYVRTRLES